MSRPTTFVWLQRCNCLLDLCDVRRGVSHRKRTTARVRPRIHGQERWRMAVDRSEAFELVLRGVTASRLSTAIVRARFRPEQIVFEPRGPIER